MCVIVRLLGSDLDGDEYSVLWYEDLIFKSNCSPMHYYSDPPKERKAPIEVRGRMLLRYERQLGDGISANVVLS